MRRQQLELMTIAAVEHVLDGRLNEDSRIEFKSEWPETSKARQLAGHANSAHGEEIIWIIGVDEKKHQLTNPQPVDLATWWAQMGKYFDDQVTPEMTDLVVPIRSIGKVTALLFETDRSPYVVSMPGGGSPERDVPIRDGTRTRSATRYDLLRLLTPTVSVPPITVLDADINAAEGKSTWRVNGQVRLYLDQRIAEASFFPVHGMQGIFETTRKESNPTPSLSVKIGMFGHGAYGGTEWREDGAMTTGPTTLNVLFRHEGTGTLPQEIADADGYTVSLSLQVASAQRSIKTTLRFPAPEVRQGEGSPRRLVTRWVENAQEPIS